MKKLFVLLFVLNALAIIPNAEAAKPAKHQQAQKERLVLMPLRVGEDIQNMLGAMETALVEGLQQQYTVFAGEDVAKKTRELFRKESAKQNCDETRCMQDIAIAFQAELIATANVTKIEGGYLLALSIRNVMDNQAVYSKSLPCENCSAFEVVNKLKEISGVPAPIADQTPVVAAPEKQTLVPVMVRIPGKNYEIGKYEVTQGEWRAVMGDSPSNFNNCGDSCPVEQVSWNDTQAYIKKLNTMSGKKFRLPTEAEWEYACYGGRKTEYCGSNNVNAVAWTNENSNNQIHPVGKRQANGYGLYDMSGNVWEWVNECWEGNCAKRVDRGGSWNSTPEYVRADNRNWGDSDGRLGNSVGFRLARTLE